MYRSISLSHALNLFAHVYVDLYHVITFHQKCLVLVILCKSNPVFPKLPEESSVAWTGVVGRFVEDLASVLCRTASVSVREAVLVSDW